jgi:hypothetical protein
MRNQRDDLDAGMRDHWIARGGPPRHFGHSMLVFALVLGVAFLSPIPAGAIDIDCFRTAGTVRDALGNAVVGATVQAPTTCTESTAVTDSTGAYVVKIKGSPISASASATATAAGMNAASKTIGSGVSYSGNNDFVLTYRMTSNILPAAFRPGSGAEIRVETTAPTTAGVPQGWTLTASFSHPETNAVTDEWVLIDDDSAGSGAQAASVAPPTTRYRRGFTSMTTAPEGSFQVSVCAVPAGFVGTCVNAAAAGLAVSNIVSPAYAIDATPPLFQASSPAQLRTIAASPTGVSFTWFDRYAGVASSGARVWIDGVERPVAVVGSQTFVTSSNSPALNPGLHSARAVVTDRAGNQAERAIVFTVGLLSPGAADAVVQEQTVEVNPDGDVPGPSQVTLPSPAVAVHGFKETLSSTTWVGHSSIKRDAVFGTLEVVFRNPAGVESLPQSVAVPTLSSTHEFAALAPTVGPLDAWIKPTVEHLPDIVAEVPLGFGVHGSTATLRPKTAALGVSAALPGFLLQPLPALSVLDGQLSSCFAAPGIATCRYDERSGASVAGWAVGVPRDGPADPSGWATGYPDCRRTDGQPCGPSAPAYQGASAHFGCPYSAVTGITGFVNLCNGSVSPSEGAESSYLDAYLNAWLYTDSDGGYPLWQQNHVAPGPGAPCPNGSPNGMVTASLQRVVVNAFGPPAAVPVRVAGTFADSTAVLDEISVMLGTETGPNEHSVSSQTGSDPVWAATPLGFQLAKTAPFARTGRYLISASNAYTPSGAPVAYGDASAAGHMWQYSDGPATTVTPVLDDVALVSGARYAQDATPAGSLIRSSLAFLAVTDFSECGS